MLLKEKKYSSIRYTPSVPECLVDWWCTVQNEVVDYPYYYNGNLDHLAEDCEVWVVHFEEKKFYFENWITKFSCSIKAAHPNKCNNLKPYISENNLPMWHRFHSYSTQIILYWAFVNKSKILLPLFSNTCIIYQVRGATFYEKCH